MTRNTGEYGYPCRHGVYVGGIGADYMCGQCENGDDDAPRRPEVTCGQHYAATGLTDLRNGAHVGCAECLDLLLERPWSKR